MRELPRQRICLGEQGHDQIFIQTGGSNEHSFPFICAVKIQFRKDDGKKVESGRNLREGIVIFYYNFIQSSVVDARAEFTILLF